MATHGKHSLEHDAPSAKRQRYRSWNRTLQPGMPLDRFFDAKVHARRPPPFSELSSLRQVCFRPCALTLALSPRRRFALRLPPRAHPQPPEVQTAPASIHPSAGIVRVHVSPSSPHSQRVDLSPHPSPHSPLHLTNCLAPHPFPVSFQLPSLPPVPSAPNAHRNPGPGQHVPPPPALLPKVAPR